MNQIYNYVKINKELTETFSKFDLAGIKYCVVKGITVATFYPRPELRSMGDVDIIVDNKKIASQILLSRNFVQSLAEREREWVYIKNGIHIELHDRLVYEQVINTSQIYCFSDEMWIYYDNHKLDESYHFIYLLLHLRKHLLNSGVGIRQFVDIAVSIQNNKALNWDWICEKLRELELYDFTSICFGLIYRWFDIKAPFYKACDDYFVNEVTEHIFNDGVFGHDNSENEKNCAINRSVCSKHKRIANLKAAVNWIFPTLQEMINSNEYPFIEKCHLFVVLAWFKRIIVKLKCRNIPKYLKVISNEFVIQKDIESRMRYLQKWKLV